MDSREMATELRMSHWSEVLRERKESGLSVRRWCRENGVNEKTYYYWQRKLRESVCNRLLQEEGAALVAAAPTFAQIGTRNKAAVEGKITIRLGGSEVEIAGNAPPVVVESVLRILRESC